MIHLGLIKKLSILTTFNKNVLVIFTGTTLAQAIPIAISPILTRLYTPDEFGVFTLFFSITNLLGIVATARYELAIVLPHNDQDADSLEKLCFAIAIAFGLVLLIVVLVLQDLIVNWLGNPGIRLWLFFVPLSVLLTGIFQAKTYRFNRDKKFRQISILKITQTTTASFVNIIMAFFNSLKGGLIIGYLMGQVMAISSSRRKKVTLNIKWKEMRDVAKTYKNFALYNAPAALLNTAAATVPVFYLSRILSKKDIGFYGLVERSIGAPISLVSYSISQVLLQDISMRYKQELPIRGRLLGLLRNLTLIGIPPFTLLFLFAEDIFAFVFGNQWAVAGKYASILSVAFFMRFVVSPLSVVLISTNNLRTLIFWQTLYFITSSGIVICGFYFWNVIEFLIAFAINDVVLYSIYLYLIFQIKAAVK
jgi:O-antigen/teichoic acid export membrane protein